MRSMLAALLAFGLAGCESDGRGSDGAVSETDAATPEPDARVSEDAGTCPPAALSDGATPLPPDVDDVIEERCRWCHSDPTERNAPMRLLTWEDFQAPRWDGDDRPVYDYAHERINNERLPMPPRPSPALTDEERADWPSLSDAERALLNSWFDDCAPAGR